MVVLFVRKNALRNYPYNFKPHMYRLHEIYLHELKSDKKYIDKYVVINYTNNLPPARLMYAINYNVRNYAQDMRKNEKMSEQ